MPYRQSFLNLLTVKMKILWFSVILPLVFAQSQFGTSYLKNSRLCAQWSCLNDHLGLQDTLPPIHEYTRILRGLLPEGPWHYAVGKAIDNCYWDRPKTYTNSCPGQALMHCVVDQLIENCPLESWRKEDACAPVSSLAGLKYMFSQSRYNDIEANLPSDHRPAWFLKNYFNVKCCDLPPLFNNTVLNQCGFDSFIHYYKQRTRIQASTNTFKVEKKVTDNGEALQVVSFDDMQQTNTSPNIEDYGEYDPLDCCDMHEFISPTWRSDCEFELSWNSETRLSIKNTTGPASTTTTEAPRILKNKDVKMVPHSCEQNNCVFKALNIVSDTGMVDIDAFSRLLNNFTNIHPSWVKAKGRVLTKCLSKLIIDYEYDCQINKILACTFDILSENCPNSITPDVCRHSSPSQNEVICQISSSKFRPVFAQSQFGTSYLKNSRLCAQWSCLNDHLGLQDTLPPIHEYTRILRGLLPEGPWHYAVGKAIDNCYWDRPKTYTNSCPGQALMHCVVDQLIENCPLESWRKEDACAPVSSLAGLKYMFSQSRYNDIEANLPSDHRPAWFLKNYFNVKCCDLPPLFNNTVLNQCGFDSFIHYYKQRTRIQASTNTFKVEKKVTDNGEALQVVSFDDMQQTNTSPNIEDYGEYDPLDCCDMHEFISPTWRSDCEFELSWNSETRLSIKNTTGPASTTTTEAPRILKNKDVKMVPHSCEQNNCVFKALNIVSDTGMVDIDAFSRLLNNFTNIHPSWVKAKGRVLTKCLSKLIIDYEYDCQINKILACTFDILSENCPNSITPDVCRHSSPSQNEVICQISSSKFRPKNRRLFCAIPSLVNHEALSQCNVNSLINLDYVSETILKPRTVFSSASCKDSTPSTICLMDKMGVLNKYNFMDFFKMKTRIRDHSYGDWHPYTNAYTAAFFNVPLYKGYCSSPKKLLNVIDIMLMTCPHSKRRSSPQCDRLFSDLTRDIPKDGTQNEQLLRNFGHILLTNNHLDIGIKPRTKTFSNPIFNFGMFDSENAPPVRIIDLRAKTEKPLVLLPVYQRMPVKPLSRDQILRSGPITPNSV